MQAYSTILGMICTINAKFITTVYFYSILFWKPLKKFHLYTLAKSKKKCYNCALQLRR